MFRYYLQRFCVHFYTLLVRHRFGNWGRKALIYPFANTLHQPQRIHVGESTSIEKEARLTCWENGQIFIGSHCHLGQHNHFTSANQIRIGDRILTGSNVLISDNSHGDTSFATLQIPPIHRPLISKGPVIIEDDVWIGQNVCILSGVTIGKGAVIGANSVVTHDIPPYTVAVGLPAHSLNN